MERPIVLRARPGHSPNCSATGSVVGAAIVTVVAASALVNAFADRFVRWLGRRGGPGGTPDESSQPVGQDGQDVTPPAEPPAGAAPRVRREAFGGIVAWPEPAALLWVDHATADAALAAGGALVGGAEAPTGALSAPTEVHVALTDHCPVRCDGCYLDAGPHRDTHADTDTLLTDLDALADLGVFELALGGGEVLLGPEVVRVAAHARARGLVPNLTTSGLGLTDERLAELAPLVGQVNVSLDGLDATYQQVRGWRGAHVATAALARLSEAGVRTGVNTVLTRRNVDTLDTLADQLVALGVSEWQWLRFKPAGRGVEAYADLALTPEQALALWPKLLAIEARTGLVMRIDCALVPFVVAHGPPVEALDRLAVAGCPAGESLWSRTAEGRWAPCSFASDRSVAGGAPDALWQDDALLTRWRARAAAPPEPCGSCTYQRLCRGGCRIVAGHLTGDELAPDPECPRVIAAGLA